VNRLRSLGLSQAILSQTTLEDLEADALGRVVFQSRGHTLVATEHADVAASLHPRLPEPVVVGDWVLLDRTGDPAWVVRVLERTHVLARRDPDRGIHTLCSHVDLLLLATALDRDLNERRLERYLAVAAEAEIPVALVLTKIDLDRGAMDAVVARLRPAFVGVYPVCAPTGEGLDEVRSAVPFGKTAALLGSSGVGKSTLVNALAGTALATASIREQDRRGRHTTTSRRLVPLPGGGWLVDNPGLRQVGPIGGAGVAQVFADVEQLAGECRFRDCGHDQEPGCAIVAALTAGQLDPARYDAWVKLQRELAYETRRLDRGAARAERARWKQIHRQQRDREAFRRRNE
jgi:ribosome biogenesis GTPase / thiamine phosphate phosphatase